VQLISYGFTFLVILAPFVLGIVFLLAAAILFTRARSRATAAFLAGVAIVTLAPFVQMGLQMLPGGTVYSQSRESIRTIVMVVGYVFQAFGLLFFALSLPKQSPKN